MSSTRPSFHSTLPWPSGRNLSAHRRSRWRSAALIAVVLWFSIGGLAHFVFTDIEARIVPPSLPWPRVIVLVSGAFELLGAAGMVWPRSRRLAAVGLLLLTVAVTPAHFYMLQHAELFDVPYWALLLRLPLQLGVLAAIAWSGGLLSRDSSRQG